MVLEPRQTKGSKPKSRTVRSFPPRSSESSIHACSSPAFPLARIERRSAEQDETRNAAFYQCLQECGRCQTAPRDAELRALCDSRAVPPPSNQAGDKRDPQVRWPRIEIRELETAESASYRRDERRGIVRDAAL